jgi:hypothetical protein
MKALIILILMTSSLCAKEIDSENKITKVSLFKDRAFVSREM